MNAYERLSLLPPRLAVTDAEIRDAYAAAGKREHPDAGGQEDAFAKLKEARDCLLSPSRRLAHWLEIHGLQGALRGTVGPQLMDWFARVAALTQRAEELIRKRDEARSALTRALLEPETQVLREELEALIEQLDEELQRLCAGFVDLERAQIFAAYASAEELLRNLSFLEKWRASMRNVYARLI